MKKFKSKVSNLYKIGLDSQLQRSTKNVYQAYETSWETEFLESEQKRQIYSEIVEVDYGTGQPDFENFTTNELIQDKKQNIEYADEESDDDDEEIPQQVQALQNESNEWWTKFSVETNRPKLLKEIAVESLGLNYQSGKLDDRIICEDKERLGKLIDVEIKILNLLEIDNESFWKTLVKSKIMKVESYEKLSRDPEVNWKTIGIQMKFEEIIENMPEAEFRYESTSEKFFDIVDRLSDFIEILNIKKLQPRLETILHPINNSVKMVNIPDDECHHGSLECLGRLKKLEGLSLSFKPSELDINYERRFHQTSTKDMRNLGNALTKIHNLKFFRICETNLSDHCKLSHIMKPFFETRILNILDFSFCQIHSCESGKLFKNVLEAATSLKELRLKGNCIDKYFCDPFSSGIKNFKGKLEFLDLSLNQILGNGLNFIIKSIRDSQNVRNLDISQCNNFHSQEKNICLNELIELIKDGSKIIKIIDFHLNKIDDERIKTLIIDALNFNYELEGFDARLSGFSTTQLVYIKVLLDRNQFYRENPILKKEHFSEEDEIAAEEFLKRTKNPLLLKMKETITKTSQVLGEAHHYYKRHYDSKTEESFLNFAKTF